MTWSAGEGGGVTQLGTPGTGDFCLAKFEMKNNGLDQAVSEPVGEPWVDITRADAVAACHALGGGYNLVSNTQWQALARNLMQQTSNWMTGVVGATGIYRGHSDDVPSAALAASPDDADGYVGTNNTGDGEIGPGTEQRRTLLLSNTHVIWDSAGNVAEMMVDNAGRCGSGAWPDCTVTDESLGMEWGSAAGWVTTSGWQEGLGLSAVNKLVLGDPNNFGSGLGAGQINIPTRGTIHRGGTFEDGVASGVLAAHLGAIPLFSGAQVGFRCVYVPPAPANLAAVQDTTAPALTLAVGGERVNPVAAGTWALEWTVEDPPDPVSGQSTPATGVRIEVRRKATLSATDPPTATDEVFAADYNLTRVQDSGYADLGLFITYLITATDAAGNSASTSHAVLAEDDCPAGYVPVPGNATPDLGRRGALGSVGLTAWSAAEGGGVLPQGYGPWGDFCVAKYEIKNGGGSSAVSEPAGLPWADVTLDQARAACQARGTGFDLISNTQWQVMAQDIARVSTNWFGNVVGTTGLARGHSDSQPATLLSASADDGDAYAGTGNTVAQAYGSGWEQRRTHVLSNGSITWDVSGNAWEYVKDQGPTCSSGTWRDCTVATNDVGVETGAAGGWDAAPGWQDLETLSARNRLLFGEPMGYATDMSVGRVWGDSAGAILRGCKYTYSSAGVFMAYLRYRPDEIDPERGFRCVYVARP